MWKTVIIDTGKTNANINLHTDTVAAEYKPDQLKMNLVVYFRRIFYTTAAMQVFFGLLKRPLLSSILRKLCHNRVILLANWYCLIVGLKYMVPHKTNSYIVYMILG